MTLKNIFKTNPSLLKEKEVKSLIKYVKFTHEENFKKFNEVRAVNDKILELCMYSSLVLKEGKSPEETLRLILTLLNES